MLSFQLIRTKIYFTKSWSSYNKIKGVYNNELIIYVNLKQIKMEEYQILYLQDQDQQNANNKYWLNSKTYSEFALT